jgi:hypothetical protein
MNEGNLKCSPKYDRVPPNAKFIVDDVEDEWGYESNPFDYVHGRFLVGSIRDWPRLMLQAFRYIPKNNPCKFYLDTSLNEFSCTKPGGWVEFQEWDANIRSEDDSLKGTHLFKLQDTVKKVFEDMGINVNPGPEIGDWLEKAGFVNIKTEVRSLRSLVHRMILKYALEIQSPSWNMAAGSVHENHRDVQSNSASRGFRGNCQCPVDQDRLVSWGDPSASS